MKMFICKFHLVFIKKGRLEFANIAASRQWFAKLSSALLAEGYLQSKADYSLFTKTSGNSFTALVIYADNILVCSNDLSAISSLKTWLHDWFALKDLGPLKFFLDLEVARSKHGIHLSQRKLLLKFWRILASLVLGLPRHPYGTKSPTYFN